MVSNQKVVVVGAGPVGALAALYAAIRGDNVEVYELRGDLRNPSTTLLNFTRSINLALSERGINAMRNANCDGLVDAVMNESIPMRGRMIHSRSKKGEFAQISQNYDVHGRTIHAIDRSSLNSRLLDTLSTFPNVKLFFSHKLTGADFNRNIAWFEQQTSSIHDKSAEARGQRFPEIEVPFDLLIGADGAHSAARFHMMKFARLNYSQEYIDTLWCEFRIPAGSAGEFQISPNHLHIWPGHESMFIAIPSLDKSFTCTLFAPSNYFTSLTNSTDPSNSSSLLLSFFDSHFPGVTPALISPEDLTSQFAKNPHLPLISLTLTPHHYSSSVVLLGDSAHAMVPFYGQGMNAGLEDVRILFSHLDAHGVYLDNITVPSIDNTPNSPPPMEKRKAARASALTAYTTTRTPDAHAISTLALQNYAEMRSHVTSRVYKARKRIEEWLTVHVPQLGWQTQYARVSFGNERYSVVREKAAWQGAVLGWIMSSLGFVGGMGVLAFVVRFWLSQRGNRGKRG